MIRSLQRLVATLLCALSVGCEPTGTEPQKPPKSVCTEFAARCELDGGALGVCESRECSDAETPPCYVCTPQH